MNIYVTGSAGYLGRAFLKAGYKPLVCNVADSLSIERAINRSRPDLVVHLAGKSNPDWCETHIKESTAINVRGTFFVMQICAASKIPAVILSSSQIWGGGWWESLWNRHSEASKTTPARNAYGMQKISAEAATLSFNADGWQNMKVVRTSCVFDQDRLGPEILDLRRGIPVDAPVFIKRSFIYMNDFISLMNEYCKWFYTMPHILHLAGSKSVSYNRFWLELADQYGFDRKLVRARHIEKDFIGGKRAVKRPHNGGLDVSLSKHLGFPQFDYVGGIRRMKNEG